MVYLTTEELYAEMVRTEKAADAAFREAQEANRKSIQLDRLYEERSHISQALSKEAKEYRAELARRANIQP